MTEPDNPPHSVKLFRAVSTLQCGEAVEGIWRESREEADAEARSWFGSPVNASRNYWIEEYDP